MSELNKMKAAAHLQRANEIISFGSRRPKKHGSKKNVKDPKHDAQRVVGGHPQGFYMMKNSIDTTEDTICGHHFDEDFIKPLKKRTRTESAKSKEIVDALVRTKLKNDKYLCTANIVDGYNEDRDKKPEPGSGFFSHELLDSDLVYTDPHGLGFCIFKCVRKYDTAKSNNLPWNSTLYPNGYLYMGLICMGKPSDKSELGLGSRYMGKRIDETETYRRGVVDMIAKSQGFNNVLIASISSLIDWYERMGYGLVHKETLSRLAK